MSTFSLKNQSEKITKNVLVIDDDKPFLEIMQILLVKSGFVPKTLANPAGIYSMVLRQRPDTILCKISFAIPLFKALNKVLQKGKYSKPKIVLLSSVCSLPDIQHAIEIGANDCLAKSVSPEIIIASLKTPSPYQQAKPTIEYLTPHYQHAL